MRKTSKTEEHALEADLTESLRIKTGGSPLSGSLDNGTTLVALTQSPKRPPQERKPPSSFTANSPAKLKLVRPGVPSGRHAAPEPPKQAARSDLTFQVEAFATIADELPPLFERHHRELFDLAQSAPLEPDWQRYLLMAAAGRVRVMTARCGDVLAGYIINVLDTHIFSKNYLYACIEKFYLDVPYRGSGFARKWFAANDADLKALGVKAVSVAAKIANDKTTADVLFKRLGYRPIETIWLREL